MLLPSGPGVAQADCVQDNWDPSIKCYGDLMRTDAGVAIEPLEELRRRQRRAAGNGTAANATLALALARAVRATESSQVAFESEVRRHGGRGVSSGRQPGTADSFTCYGSDSAKACLLGKVLCGRCPQTRE